MKNEVNRALAAEKKQYNIPSTTIIPCYASLICQTASPVDFSITGNSSLGVGGEATTIEPM